MTAWFLVPYLQNEIARYCAMDRHTPELDQWREREVGNKAVVRVRAPYRVIRSLPFPALSETEASRLTSLSSLVREVPEKSPSKEVDQIYSYWAGIGFGSGYRIPRGICRIASSKGIEPDRWTRLLAPLFDQRGVFGATSVIDSFVRANENPLSDGGLWTAGITGGASVLQVVSNQCARNTTGGGAAYRNNVNYGPDCETWVTYPTTGASGDEAIVYCRLLNLGAGTTDGYYNYGTAGGFSVLSRYDNGSGTQLGASFTLTINNGDSKGIEAIGDQIGAYRKAGAGAWSQTAVRTDATYNSAGRIGLTLTEATFRAAPFGGGTLTASGSITPTIGGAAISGIASRMDLGMAPRTMVKIA